MAHHSSSHLVMDGHMMRVFVTQYVPGDDNVFVTAGWDEHCTGKII